MRVPSPSRVVFRHQQRKFARSKMETLIRELLDEESFGEAVEDTRHEVVQRHMRKRRPT